MKTIKSKRFAYKRELLDTYIKENYILRREDIEKIGYNNIGMALYNYCVKKSIFIMQKNYYTWIKDGSTLSELRALSYVKSKDISGNRPRVLFTPEEKEDTFLLTWMFFKKKYPKRIKAQYDLWRSRMISIKAQV